MSVAEFAIYSDASVRRDKAGLACCLVRSGSVVARFGKRARVPKGCQHKTIWAELHAMTMGIDALTPGSHFVAYSDLRDVDGALSRFPAIWEKVEINGRCRVEYIPPESRPLWYFECHRAARAHMRGDPHWPEPYKLIPNLREPTP